MNQDNKPIITFQEAAESINEFTKTMYQENQENKMKKEISINGRKAIINVEDGYVSIFYRGQELSLQLTEFTDIAGIINAMADKRE